MDTGGLNNYKMGSDSQDSDDIIPPGTSSYERPVFKLAPADVKSNKTVPLTPKGVEQAKKRLRAFSIQKKSSLSLVSVPKPINTGSATVFIGKAAGVKTQPKPEPDPNADPKKPPKPPKPGAKLPGQPESYINTQKKTLAEIEDMKRKMELVELGIPLGLICPAPNSDKAMPTKAMPPIKTFLNSDKVDELIREAKQAREEGREFKFDYSKLLPDYANPFQRNKSVPECKELPEAPKPDEIEYRKSREKDKRRSDKPFDVRRLSSYKTDKNRRREDKFNDKSTERDENVKERDKSKDADSKYKDKDSKSKDKDLKTIDNRSKERGNKKEEAKKGVAKDEKEAEVDLTDFVVCDSWSDNEEKSKDSTPKVEEEKRRIEEQVKEITPVVIDPMEQLRSGLEKKYKRTESTKPKLKRLNPVDSFKFEIEEPDEDILDMFDENYEIEKYAKSQKKNVDSPDMQLFDYDDAKEATFDGMADDTFLESVINEIKQDEIDETSQDKALVEYDESPSKDEEARGSVTPEIDDRVRQLHSSRSDYSDSFKSTESGYKSTESLKGSEYKSEIELEIIVEEKKRELERIVGEREINKHTADSLETWSFVLKICQPLLFRHDRNKCYKETRIAPKLWYTENPKLCNCVKDRRVVYEELEMCKMELVDNLYNDKQMSPRAPAPARGWYPALGGWAGGGAPAPSDWETEDSQPRATPEPSGDISLDKEYQRFMQAVWPEVAEPKSETPRSTPVRRDKKKADDELNAEKKAKKLKTGSEGWSQESDVEEEVKPTRNTSVGKKVKVEKPKRKRKRSSSTSVTDSSESDAKRRRKLRKKKEMKKSKSKETRRRRVSKKNVKKLKDKPKKKKKVIEIDEDSDIPELEKGKKKREKKIKKKKQLKLKKKNQKKKKAKAKSSSSSDSSPDSESEPERKSKKKKKSVEKKKKRKTSFESKEELFDVNILKNIKTERETDEEIPKQLEFSPRRQKPREIIDVKELQNDFVGNSIQIKKEVEQDEKKNKEDSWKSGEVGVVEKQQESQESQTGSIKGKETLPNFKEQEESQSTSQIPPEESNHSQCSSQESVYSLKDQPIYEKDESHLRPSSQNSNYSFHDVMASGMYTKSMEHAKQKNLQRLELEMQSDSHEHEMPRQEHDSRSRDHVVQRQEHDSRSREHDVQRQEHDSRSREHDVQRQEHDSHSREHDVQREEHDSRSREHDVQEQEHDSRSRDHVVQRQEHDSRSRDHDVQRQEHDSRSREHDVQRQEHDSRIRDHDVQRQEHDSRSRERDVQRQEHDMQRREHNVQSHKHDMFRHEHDMSREHEIHSQKRDMQGQGQGMQTREHEMLRHDHEMQRRDHEMQRRDHEMQRHEHDMQNHEHDMQSLEYEQENYDMYEQMAMAYQSDVANQLSSPPGGWSRRIETLVRARPRGEIKCDWRAGDSAAPAPRAAPSRWGLKPGDVNIVLTGGEARRADPVYRIQSLANRTDNSASGYDEAYMDMYGAADKLQYGDCFSTEERAGGGAPGGGVPGGGAPGARVPVPLSSSLDARINLALRSAVLGEAAHDLNETDEKDEPDKGILVTKSPRAAEARGVKRVSFADGYRPGQDSDVEEPPVKKKRRGRRLGCAWPCPAAHADHVPLWDALPPPPPPAGSPPPPAPAAPPAAHLLRRPPALRALHALQPPPRINLKFDPNSMPAFMPPEPPPGLISFQNM